MEHNDQQDDQQQEIISAHETDSFLLANYHQIAQELNDGLDLAAAERALAPILNAPDTTQISLLKALAQENTMDAADIAQAVQTVTTNKEIRKEARRTLVRLENADVYPGWEPPEGPTLSQALEQITNPDSEAGDPILTELQSLFAGAEGLFAEDETVEAVHDFITAWTDGNYDEAYDHLASTSPLRAGSSREDWAARRQEWFNTAHPTKLQVTFVDPIDEDDLDPTDEDETESPTIEAGWSLEFADLQQGAALPELPELPFTTALFAETGRHWFWTNYTVVQEDDRWVIQDMIDVGARAFELSEDELRERINDLKEQVALAMEGDDDDEEDDDDLDDEDLGDFEDEEDDDDLDDEEDDDDLDDESLMDSLEILGNVLNLTVKAMHYSDALIAKVQGRDVSVYELAVEQALSANEAERAAVYAQKWAENIPETRSQSLNTLAVLYSAIAASSHEDDEHDEEERFINLAKTTLRSAITGGTNPKGEILLANMLVQDDEHLDEAESLLLHAKEATADNESFISIDLGLAEIAMRRNNTEVALNHYLHASSLNAEDEDVWFRIGYLQRELGRYPDAILSLQRSLALAPELTEAYTELASIHVAQKSLNKAREVLREGLDVNPDAADLFAALALVYLQGNDTRSAAKYLEQGEALDPEDELVQEARQVFNAQRTQQRSQQRYKQNKPNNKKRR
jgi:tetratricopeptide (TPR) repeat protein